MANIPLGINVGVIGAAKATQSLNRIAAASRGISVAGVAAGTFLGGALLKVAKAGLRYGSQAIQSANKLAEDAANGKASLDGISQGGLVAAQQLTDGFNRVRNSIFKAFIGSLPMIVMVLKSMMAQAMFYYDTIKGIFGPGFFSDLSASLPVIGRNIGALFVWIGTNWKDIAYNMGETLVTILSNSFENIKRLFVALKGFFSGQGWNFDGVGLTSGANLREIKGPQFERLPIQDRVAGAVAAALETRDAKLNQIAQEYNATMGAKIQQQAAPTQAQSTNQKNEALIRGSVAEASARAQAIAQNQQLAVQRQQLAVQQRTARAVESMAGNAGIVEARIA